MQLTHLRHGCDQLINRFGDTSTGLVGGTFPTGPDIRRMIDLKNILTKLGEGPLPKHSVTPLVEEMLAILCKRSEEHTSELQSQSNLVCRLLLEKKNKKSKERSH